MVDKLYNFCKESKMQVNISKAQWLIFEKKESSNTLNFQLSFCGNYIERVKVFKYLGIFFDHKLTFAEHVKSSLIKADKAAHLFWKFINRFQTLNVSIIQNLLVFNMVVLPILLYGAEIWFPLISKKLFKKMNHFT
jgi:hypothetical protein